MSWVPRNNRKGRRAATPSASVVSHTESVSDHHHHRHHDEVHTGPGGAYVSHEEEYHQHEPLPDTLRKMQLDLMDPHDQTNQLLVQFPVDIISTAEGLENDKDQTAKLKVNIWDCMIKAAQNQMLKVVNEQGCAVPINIACMKGFVYKICIRGYQNTFPFRVAARFPGTECSYVMDADCMPEGTFCLDPNTPYCCDLLCVFEAKHRDSVKKQLRKYGGYHKSEELWHGMKEFHDHAYVPINCMGAHIVLQNRFNPATNRGFRVSEEIMEKDGHGVEYYKWDMSVIHQINERFQDNVLPEIQGKLIDFSCPNMQNYIIEHLRADAEPKGKEKRGFTSREGTIYENDPAGGAAFTTTERIRYNCLLYLGFTTKASIREACCP